MFQYSLCRIVYCCAAKKAEKRRSGRVSIFALSNRVLLRVPLGHLPKHFRRFNIRSVESCTAASHSRWRGVLFLRFQYSLCRIVYCCDFTGSHGARASPRFNIRSVESCTAARPGSRPCRSAALFQYSLCRIVYCCKVRGRPSTSWKTFQYSLCRIVYCCFAIAAKEISEKGVSIFALSNRVLLPAALA